MYRHKQCDVMIFVLMLAILASFFMPWVSVNSRQEKAMNDSRIKKNTPSMNTISGFRIPFIVNSSESRAIVSVIKLAYPNIKNIEAKSSFVWCLPILSIAMWALSNKFTRKRPYNIGLGIFGISFFMYGLIKLFSMNNGQSALDFKIEFGLLLSLYGFLGIGAVNLFKLSLKKRKI